MRPLTEAGPQHARLQELIAAFADGELPVEERRIVEDHLRGCGPCQRELALQQDLSAALAREPASGASAALRRRIEWMGEPAAAPRARGFQWTRRWAASAAAALVLIGIAGGAGLLAVRRGGASRPAVQIPVLRDALADCRRAMARNFPRKADLPALAQGLEFPVRALDRPGVELFSTWKTTLAGAPAAGLAYHWRGIVVVQYTVSSELIRQQPGLGEALSGAPLYAATELGQGMIAFVRDGSGTLLIGEAPPEELERLIL